MNKKEISEIKKQFTPGKLLYYRYLWMLRWRREEIKD